MSGLDEQPLSEEFPVCMRCGEEAVCWQGLEIIEGFVKGVEVLFTPHYFLNQIHAPSDMKRVGVKEKEKSERWATFEELEKIKYIRCMECAVIFRPEEDEEQRKKYNLILKIGRKEIVRARRITKG